MHMLQLGETPLHLAIRRSSIPMVFLLIAHGAEIHLQDKVVDTVPAFLLS